MVCILVSALVAPEEEGIAGATLRGLVTDFLPEVDACCTGYTCCCAYCAC